ncbi:MAG TPA: hypothetical protein VIY09_08710 [Rhizomicrobium sp.]
MSKKLIKVEIVQQGDERVLLKVYDDATEERTPVVSGGKKNRERQRPYWYWSLRSGQRKFF